MKYIFVNLKRFDIPAELDGVNRIAPMKTWGRHIINSVKDFLKGIEDVVECAVFLPEAHIILATEAKSNGSKLHIGCQGVFRKDTGAGKNFGSFTANRTAKAMKELGCDYTIIGHCEERMDNIERLAEAGVVDPDAVSRLLRCEVEQALNAGMKVLFCVGEKEEEQENWEEVIGAQLSIGLKDLDLSNVAIAYEPIWSIGPGKQVPDASYIRKIAKFIKEKTGCPVIYGGGLKEENADMIASINEVDGGLIALTRFQGEIGFYPDEFIRIVKKYLEE